MLELYTHTLCKCVQCCTCAHPPNAPNTHHVHVRRCASSAAHAHTLPKHQTHTMCMCVGAHTVLRVRTSSKCIIHTPRACAQVCPQCSTCTHPPSTHYTLHASACSAACAHPLPIHQTHTTCMCACSAARARNSQMHQTHTTCMCKVGRGNAVLHSWVYKRTHKIWQHIMSPLTFCLQKAQNNLASNA